MKDEEMTTKEVLVELGISRPTLYRRIEEGLLKPLPKSPGQVRAYPLKFRRSDVERIKREAAE